MHKVFAGILAAAWAFFGVASLGRGQDDLPVEMKLQAPGFEGISDWINSKPLKLADLRGRVIVLHFWTFG